MDANGWSVLITAVVGGIIAIMTAWAKIRENARGLNRLEIDVDSIWRGQLDRGYHEAADLHHLTRAGSGWIVAADAKSTLFERRDDLYAVWDVLKLALNRDPNGYEYSRALEVNNNLREWITHYVCGKLGTRHYGCLAIAYETVRGEQ